MSNYPLATSTWDKEELDAIQSVIDSDKYTMGQFVKTFENNFGKFIKRKDCVMVSSGSAVNLLSIASLFYTKKPKLKLEMKLLFQRFLGLPLISLQQFGLKLKFVDIDLNTLNYDLNALESAVTDKTKMIVAVNLLGNPNDFDKLTVLLRIKYIYF